MLKVLGMNYDFCNFQMNEHMFMRMQRDEADMADC